MKEQSFIPPSRMLMGPGPSDVSARVLEAMARPTIGHLDPQFISMMDEIKKLLQDHNYLDSILLDGVEKADKIASKKIKNLKEIVGF